MTRPFSLSVPRHSRPVVLLLPLLGIAAGLLAALPASSARAATAAQVDAAIDKAKAYIYAQQKKGNWEGPMREGYVQEGGLSSLATYALLAADENKQDPRILEAVKFLETVDTEGIYALGLRCQVWLNMGPPWKKDVKDAFEKDAIALIKAAHPDRKLPQPSAFYRYTVHSSDWDHSAAQYGVLGIWACDQAGMEVPTGYWGAVDYGWRMHQYPDGGWGYAQSGGGAAAAAGIVNIAPPTPPATPPATGGKPGATGVPPKGPPAPPPVAPVVPKRRLDQEAPKASMTAAGIATLFITQDYLHGLDGIGCTGNSYDPAIEAGINWMGSHFREIYQGDVFYTLYGLERIGVASGRKYFGSVDWYKEGSDYLIKSQGAAGNWRDLHDTCFALIFLARGRAPVVMNKLQYELSAGPGRPKSIVGNWNERPRDAANVTKWIGKQNEKQLNWQVVNLSVPVEDLHDAPILYISGNQVVDFKEPDILKMRQYVEEGGLIYANADCGNVGFAQSMRKVAAKVFPAYEFRDLPPESAIYTSQQFPREHWNQKPKVEGMSNGARELFILVPNNDPSRYWQTKTYGGREPLHQLIDDIFLYTVDRGAKGGVRTKGETFVVRQNPAVKANKTIHLARLQFPGNWDPEPGGWRRLNGIMHNTLAVDMDVQTVKLGEGKLDNSYKVAHITGTFKVSLTAAAREEIKKFVEGGGTLIVDACGGDAEFAQAMDSEITTIFAGSTLSPTPLPTSAECFAVGPQLARVDYRAWAKKIVGNLHTPKIRGMEVNGRLAVFLSSEDLSTGMVGVPVDGIYGYDVNSATTLMEKLVLYGGK